MADFKMAAVTSPLIIDIPLDFIYIHHVVIDLLSLTGNLEGVVL